LNRTGNITPVREGRTVCVNGDCRQIIKWNAHDPQGAALDCLKAWGELYEGTKERRKRPAAMGRKSMGSRIKRSYDLPAARRKKTWREQLLSEDKLGLEYAVAWSAAGGTFESPKPYRVCPWDSDSATGPACDWDGLFPKGFAPLLRQFVQNYPCSLRSRRFYNTLWRRMCDSIRHDENLRSCPKIKVCVGEVVEKAMWWEKIGCNAFDLEATPATFFRMNEAIVLKSTTPTAKRGGAQQPQAVGRRKKRVAGKQGLIPGTSASSSGVWSSAVPPPTSGTVDLVAHTGKSRRIGEA
jgi:hypothetical protein